MSTFTLTSETNQFPTSTTSNSGNDTFNAPLINDKQTLNNEDQLDGGDGYDVLNAEINTNVTPAQIKKIEEINLTFRSGATFGMDNVTGVQKLSIKVNGNSIGISNSNTDNQILLNILNITSAGNSPNTIDLSGITAVNKNLNISGNQDLTINNIVIGDGGIVDATNLKANDSLDIQANGSITVKGSNVGDDDISVYGNKNITITDTGGDNTINVIGDTVSATDTNAKVNINTGKGSDNINVDSGNNITITDAGGNNTINVGDITTDTNGNIGTNATINIKAGTGDDSINVYGGKNITITDAGGNNFIDVDLGTNRPANTSATVNITTGAGNDEIWVENGSGSDSVTVNAGAGNDTIYIPRETLNNNYKLDGGAGYDVLNAEINTDVTPAQIKNIEEINLAFMNDVTFNMKNVTGVQKLSIDSDNKDTTSNDDSDNKDTTSNDDSDNKDTTSNDDSDNKDTTSNDDSDNKDTTSNDDSDNKDTTSNDDSDNKDTTSNNLPITYSPTISGINSTNIDTTIRNLFNSTVTFEFTDTALKGSNDVFNLHLGYQSNDIYGSITIKNVNSNSTNGLETLNLYSESNNYSIDNSVYLDNYGLVNVIKNLDVNPLKNLNIFGTKDLIIGYDLYKNGNYLFTDVNTENIYQNKLSYVNIANKGIVDASKLEASDFLALKANGSITVKGSKTGNDFLVVKDAKSLTANLGNGDNVGKFNLSETGTANITSGLGNDKIYVEGGKNVIVNSGFGDDAIYVDNGKNIKINAGAGNDNITVDGGKNIIINAGLGDNTIKVGTTTAPADDATINITGGAGVDNVTVNLTNGTDSGTNSNPKQATVNIDTGAGDDQITVNSRDSKDSVTIKAGAGNDIIDLDTGSYAGAAKIYGGAGKDDITLAATHKASTIVLTQDDLSTISDGNTDATKADTITNFDTTQDKIDLSALFSFYSESNSPAEVTNLPDSNSSIKSGGVYITSNGFSGGNGYTKGVEFVVVDTSQNLDSNNTNDSAIYYVKDANNDGTIQTNEIKLVAVVADTGALTADHNGGIFT